MFLAEHPRRNMWIGISTAYTILGERLAPKLADFYLARTGVSGQQTGDDLPRFGVNIDEPSMRRPTGEPMSVRRQGSHPGSRDLALDAPPRAPVRSRCGDHDRAGGQAVPALRSAREAVMLVPWGGMILADCLGGGQGIRPSWHQTSRSNARWPR